MEAKGMSKIAFGFAVVLALVLGFVFKVDDVAKAYTVNATGDAQINVQINNKTIVDITPQAMDWGANDPGTIVKQYTEPTNGLTLTQIQIENMGSTDITYIWANVTQPTTNPFGTGNLNNYDPGNWIQLKPSDNPNVNMSFVDRVEFNSSVDYIYLNKAPNWVSFGKIRDAYNEYFWNINATVTTDPQAYCNGSIGTDADLVIGRTPHNTTWTGTIDLVNGDVAWNNIVSTGDPNWGIVDGIKVGNNTYCVAVYWDCSYMRVYRWNADAPGAASCTAFGTDGLTLNGGTPIYPGGSLIADVELHIPYGVPDGTLPTGTLTVVASAV